MKRKVSLLMVLVSLFLLVTMAAGSAQAASVSLSSQSVRGRVCDKCNVGMMFTSYSNWKPWLATGETRPCSLDSSLSDIRQERLGIGTDKCNHCGATHQFIARQYRWLCPHQ